MRISRDNACNETLLQHIAELVVPMQLNAAELDRQADFPTVDVEALRNIGCLSAPLPTNLGGLGLGTSSRGSSALARVLRLLGRGNLAVARIFEAHVNALRLIFLYGSTVQQARAATDVLTGHLFGLWVTDGAEPLRIVGSAEAGHLSGGKAFCSAAGYATRAVVTATSDEKVHLLRVEVPSIPCARDRQFPPQGMRATATGPMSLEGVKVSPAFVIGPPGIYLQEPEFSAGAWRTCAALLGGLDSLIAEARRQLIERHRDDQPYQLARIGYALIAQETAAMWVFKAARIGDDLDALADERHAFVNLSRIAIERACLDALELVHRSLGLSAFVPPNPIERVSRDLSTYLRQPAPDEALADAATWFMRHELPDSEAIAL
jgi:hypothetical protein